MTAAERCPECGGPLMGGSQKGMCARCLLAAALRNPSTAAMGGLPVPGDWIGSYRVIRLLGEGGMGMVYLADQENPSPGRWRSRSSNRAWTRARCWRVFRPRRRRWR
jgi:hypothetical protein